MFFSPETILEATVGSTRVPKSQRGVRGRQTTVRLVTVKKWVESGPRLLNR